MLNVFERKRLEKYLIHNQNSTNISVLLCLFTGLRIGELCGLKWGNIDFDNGTLMVSRTVQRINKHGKSEVVIGSPKSKSSIRIVPIPEFLLAILKKKERMMTFISSPELASRLRQEPCRIALSLF